MTQGATALAFERVRIRGVRNLAKVDLEPSPGLNLIFGDNGQGKTSLIEALYLLGTTRSFRTERLADAISEGAELAAVSARVLDDGVGREQRAVLSAKERRYSVDEAEATSLGEYAVLTPMVVFHPGELSLVTGPASLRRRLLQRIALYTRPDSHGDRVRLNRAQMARKEVLRYRGPSAPELDAFEQVMAFHGVRYGKAVSEAAGQLLASLEHSFAALAPSGLELKSALRLGGSLDQTEFKLALERSRARDVEARSATYGPAKDELWFEIGGRSARRHASQGQQRLLTLALKLAELEAVQNLRSKHPVLLLDDVSSELDADRTNAVLSLLARSQSQIFITTTRRELFATSDLWAEKRDWLVSQGELTRT